MRRAPLLIGSLRLLSGVGAADLSQWRGRSVYQVLTDRFARSDGSTTARCDTHQSKYCGGSWNGIVNQLDYIQGMGFDAVWISPITKNIEGYTAHGEAYHGYWQRDINSLNPHFGSRADLTALSRALHSRGMYLMVDIVVNHNAWPGNPESIDYSSFEPFNKPSDYHIPHCEITYDDLQDANQLTKCWVGDRAVSLPDLRTEDKEVREKYGRWIADLINDYAIDGFRLDTVLQVEKDFWPGFTNAARDAFMLGEVFNGNATAVCDYGEYLPGLLNYPVYLTLSEAFGGSIRGFHKLAESMRAVRRTCADVSLLGTFSENHDNPRFAADHEDVARAKNVITFTMLSGGIPIIYQGQEQHYRGIGGVGVPYNREALWLSEYNSDHELYRLIARLNAIRKAIISENVSFAHTQAETTIANDDTMALRRGRLLFVLSNRGSQSGEYHVSVPYDHGVGHTVTDVLTCEMQSSTNGSVLDVTIRHGQPRVFYSSVGTGSLCP